MEEEKMKILFDMVMMGFICDEKSNFYLNLKIFQGISKFLKKDSY